MTGELTKRIDKAEQTALNENSGLVNDFKTTIQNLRQEQAGRLDDLRKEFEDGARAQATRLLTLREEREGKASDLERQIFELREQVLTLRQTLDKNAGSVPVHLTNGSGHHA